MTCHYALKNLILKKLFSQVGIILWEQDFNLGIYSKNCFYRKGWIRFFNVGFWIFLEKCKNDIFQPSITRSFDCWTIFEVFRIKILFYPLITTKIFEIYFSKLFIISKAYFSELFFNFCKKNFWLDIFNRKIGRKMTFDFGGPWDR